MTPSPFGRHERIVARIVHLFLLSLDSQKSNCQVYAGLDWIVHQHTVVRPDVMVGGGKQPEQHPEYPPSIVVEVLSPTTEHHDRTTKCQLYQEQRVPIYLMVDADAGAVECWKLVGGEYQHHVLPDDPILVLPGGCELSLSKSRWMDP